MLRKANPNLSPRNIGKRLFSIIDTDADKDSHISSFIRKNTFLNLEIDGNISFAFAFEKRKEHITLTD